MLYKTSMAAGLQSRWILVEDFKSHKPEGVCWEGGLTPHLLLMRLHHLVIIKILSLNLSRNCSHRFSISFINNKKDKCLKYLENCSRYLCVNQESTFWTYSLALDKIHVWKKYWATNNNQLHSFFPLIHTTDTDLSLKLSYLPLSILNFFFFFLNWYMKLFFSK